MDPQPGGLHFQTFARPLILAAAFFLPAVCWAQDKVPAEGKPAAAPAKLTSLPTGTRLAIIGDSITESKGYSRVIETYLIACMGRMDLNICNYGLGGDTSSAFSMRLKNDFAYFKPTAITLCYGMNDGAYRSFTEPLGQGYKRSMCSVLDQLPVVGVRIAVIGSPGDVDTKYFAKVMPGLNGQSPADAYNFTLQKLGEIGEQLAGEYHFAFADIHTPLLEAMQNAKAKLGPDYPVCGDNNGAGIHPGANGSLIMAGSFLKALGCDGSLAEIDLDMQGGATASDGHKVLSASGGKVELESTRYPYCFDHDPKVTDSARSILPFYSFNQDLNRFVLKVKNLKSPKAQVTWGGASKEFTREQLESGINLAAEFDSTPFDTAFLKFMAAVVVKENNESQTIKGIITFFRPLIEDVKDDKELLATIDQLRSQLAARRDKLEKDLYASLVPVKHTIEVKELRQ